MFVKNLMNNKTGTGVVLVVSNTINNLGFNKILVARVRQAANRAFGVQSCAMSAVC